MAIRVIEFKTEYRNGKDPLDWVLYTGTGATSATGNFSHATWERVKSLQPPDFLDNDEGGLKMAAMRHTWEQIEPHYDAWKNGEELPETGTPLAAWSGVNADQAKALKRVQIKTVEDVANVKEDVLMKAPLPNMRDLKKQAQAYLDGLEGADLAKQIAELKEQNAEMVAMLAEQTKPAKGKAA